MPLLGNSSRRSLTPLVWPVLAPRRRRAAGTSRCSLASSSRRRGAFLLPARSRPLARCGGARSRRLLARRVPSSPGSSIPQTLTAARGAARSSSSRGGPRGGPSARRRGRRGLDVSRAGGRPARRRRCMVAILAAAVASREPPARFAGCGAACRRRRCSEPVSAAPALLPFVEYFRARRRAIRGGPAPVRPPARATSPDSSCPRLAGSNVDRGGGDGLDRRAPARCRSGSGAARRDRETHSGRCAAVVMLLADLRQSGLARARASRTPVYWTRVSCSSFRSRSARCRPAGLDALRERARAGSSVARRRVALAAAAVAVCRVELLLRRAGRPRRHRRPRTSRRATPLLDRLARRLATSFRVLPLHTVLSPEQRHGLRARRRARLRRARRRRAGGGARGDRPLRGSADAEGRDRAVGSRARRRGARRVEREVPAAAAAVRRSAPET